MGEEGITYPSFTMQAPTESVLREPVPKQPLAWRLLWFVIGGVMSTALNAGPFKLMRDYAHWPTPVCYALSLLLVTTVFAIWNYYINFRTDRSLRDCTGRYLMCVALCSAINYALVLSGLKAWGHGWLVVIATVQVGMGGVKFLLYHFWVYPHRSESQRTAPIDEAERVQNITGTIGIK